MRIMKDIKLILSGSGALYPVHLGAIIRLRELGYNITEIAGTSGGAIVAAVVACGYSNKELLDIVKESWPNKHGLIKPSLWNLFFKWGLIDGEPLEKLLDKYLVNYFKQTKIPLHVVTTKPRHRQNVVFSSVNTPEMNLAKAVRASLSIPVVFTPTTINGFKYVDGGVGANFVLDLFGNREDVLGLRFVSRAEEQKAENDSLLGFLFDNVETLIEASTREHVDDATKARIIFLESKYKGLKFDITDSDIDAMVTEGRVAVDRWSKKGGL